MKKKKHLFLIQVHKEWELFEKILDKLNSENHYFAVNIDSKSKEYGQLLSITKNYKNIIQITNYNVVHGGFSQVKCTVEQMKYALAYHINFDYFHTISGQDYPCVSTEQFDAFFEENDKSYMMLDTEEEVSEWRNTKYRKRMEYWFFWDVFNSSLSIKLHMAGICNRFMKLIPRKCTFLSLIWGGWNWFSLQADVVLYLIQYMENHPKFYKRFQYTNCCDELIFSTILNPVSDKFQIVRRNSLRYVQWHPKRACQSLPLIVNENEYSEIKNSGAFFCRKVEFKESAKLIKLLDSDLQISGEN